MLIVSQSDLSTWGFVELLRCLPRLNSIDISNTQVGNPEALACAPLPPLLLLRSLACDSNARVSSLLLSLLPCMPVLSSLSAMGVPDVGCVVPVLPATLTSLCLSRTDSVGPGELRALAHRCPRLHLLRVGETLVDDPSVSELLAVCTQLQTLHVNHCRALSDAAFAVPGPQLELLDTQGTRITRAPEGVVWMK